MKTSEFITTVLLIIIVLQLFFISNNRNDTINYNNYNSGNKGQIILPSNEGFTGFVFTVKLIHLELNKSYSLIVYKLNEENQTIHLIANYDIVYCKIVLKYSGLLELFLFGYNNNDLIDNNSIIIKDVW